MCLRDRYPLVMTNCLLWKLDEHGPFIVDLPINSMVIFHSFLFVYQAG
jgi:hypothetical protein